MEIPRKCHDVFFIPGLRLIQETAIWKECRSSIKVSSANYVPGSRDQLRARRLLRRDFRYNLQFWAPMTFIAKLILFDTEDDQLSPVFSSSECGNEAVKIYLYKVFDPKKIVDTLRKVHAECMPTHTPNALTFLRFQEVLNSKETTVQTVDISDARTDLSSVIFSPFDTPLQIKPPLSITESMCQTELSGLQLRSKNRKATEPKKCSAKSDTKEVIQTRDPVERLTKTSVYDISNQRFHDVCHRKRTVQGITFPRKDLAYDDVDEAADYEGRPDANNCSLSENPTVVHNGTLKLDTSSPSEV
jgi:hypothetical protein